jgi:hypothetical protein
MSNYGAYHLANNPDLYEVQRTNNFELVVHFDDNQLTVDDSTDPQYITGNPQEIIRLSVVRASVPNFEQQVLEIKRGNSTIKAAGVPTFQAGSIVVNDFIGANTKSVLLAWQRLSYNVSKDTVVRMKDYKKNCQLLEYTRDYQLVRYWDLKGCWISAVSEPEYNMEGSEKKTITGTLQYDRAEMHMADEE